MHITLLDNMLKGDFIRESSIPVNCLVILLPILFIILMVFSGRIPLIVAGMIIIIGAIIGLGIIAYQYGYHVPIAAPLTAAMLAFFAGTVYNYATEGSQKRYIKSAFSQYLSPTVIDQLLANPDKLTLGGERREISIFFSDVQGFTSISEKLDPSQLTELLNDYLSMMTDTILESGGPIDKYEGDAIIAFWNAPVNLEAHAARALRASMACGGLLEEKRTFFEEKFRAWNIDTQGLNTRLLTRIGLNTGYAVVGNMGSSKRFDYTMLGDAVNLASRLEGLNKQFGTYLMCSDATFGRAREAASFFGRKLAQVAVVGKREPVTVWEPMEEEAFRAGEKTIRRFDQARDLFDGGEFERALPLFTSLTGEDKPSFFYAEQCRYYLAHPDEWKGYWRAVSK
jgi:adenylate cyclase